MELRTTRDIATTVSATLHGIVVASPRMILASSFAGQMVFSLQYLILVDKRHMHTSPIMATLQDHLVPASNRLMPNQELKSYWMGEKAIWEKRPMKADPALLLNIIF